MERRIYSALVAKEEMQKSVDYYTARIEAWEKVKRLYTKSGQPFKVLSKNFENLRFVEEYGSKKARVFFREKNGAYAWDDIYLTDIYNNGDVTPDAIAEKIANTLTNYKAWEEKDKRGADAVAGQIDVLKESLETIKKAIEESKAVNTQCVLKGYVKDFLGIL